MHRLQHFVGHGGRSRDGQKFPARANGHFLVFLIGKHRWIEAHEVGWDNIRSEPSLRAQRSNPEPQKTSNCTHCSSQARQAHAYFPTAFAIARQIWSFNSVAGWLGIVTAGASRFLQASTSQHPDLAVGVIEVAAA